MIIMHSKNLITTYYYFIKKCILSSIEREIPLTDGVCFEEHLGSLAR